MIVENFGVVLFDGSEISFGQFLHLFSENLIAGTVCDGVAPIEERNVTEIGGNRPTGFSIRISFQRKVFQTSGSYAGARYTSKLFSIIQTCIDNNINVEKYIEYVLNNINNKNLTIDDLTPYSSHILKAIK